MLNRTEQNLKARGDRDCFCSHGAHAVEESIPPSAHGVGRAPDYYYRTWLKAIIQAVHVGHIVDISRGEDCVATAEGCCLGDWGIGGRGGGMGCCNC